MDLEPASTDQHTCNTSAHLWYAPADSAWGYSPACLKCTRQGYAQGVRFSLTTAFYQNRDRNMRAVDQDNVSAVVICSSNDLRVRHCVPRALEYAHAISISLIQPAFGELVIQVGPSPYFEECEKARGASLTLSTGMRSG